MCLSLYNKIYIFSPYIYIIFIYYCYLLYYIYKEVSKIEPLSMQELQVSTNVMDFFKMRSKAYILPIGRCHESCNEPVSKIRQSI